MCFTVLGVASISSIDFSQLLCLAFHTATGERSFLKQKNVVVKLQKLAGEFSANVAPEATFNPYFENDWISS